MAYLVGYMLFTGIVLGISGVGGRDGVDRMTENVGRKVEVLRQLLVLKRRKAGEAKASAAALERQEIRKFVSRLRGRVELHKGGSVLDIVLNHIDQRG